jgi:hypothetical protein
MLLTVAAIITLGVITIYACEHPDGPGSVPPTDTQQKWQKQFNDIVDKFLKYYSVTLNNYPVQESYLVNPTVIKAGPLAGGI